MSGFFKRGGKYDWTRHQNAHLDELLDMGAKAWDPADRQKIYSEVQDILMADALILPIFWPKELYVTRAGVKGLTFDNTEHYPLYYDVYLSK